MKNDGRPILKEEQDRPWLASEPRGERASFLTAGIDRVILHVVEQLSKFWREVSSLSRRFPMADTVGWRTHAPITPVCASSGGGLGATPPPRGKPFV